MFRTAEKCSAFKHNNHNCTNKMGPEVEASQNVKNIFNNKSNFGLNCLLKQNIWAENISDIIQKCEPRTPTFMTWKMETECLISS